MTPQVWLAIVTGVFTTVNTTILAIVRLKQDKMHKQVNGRMDELLRLQYDRGYKDGQQNGTKNNGSPRT